MQCPACGVEAKGNFCSSCGAPLSTKKCPGCGVEVLSSSRFCTGCGKALNGTESGPGRASSRAKGGEPQPGGNAKQAWWAAAVIMGLLLLALGYPALSRNDGSPSGPASPPGMGGERGSSGLVDLTTMPVDSQATLLFNRVMTSSSVGDTADVEFFLPKAILIHEQLNPTDPDGLYHFALLYQVGGDFEAALAKARQGLAEVPDYLLLLAVAAESLVNLGNEEEAADLYRRFLAVYDEEMELMRPGYEHHQPIFPVYRARAEEFLGRG